MSEYCKIHTVWKRDTEGKIMSGRYSLPSFEYLEDNLWEWTEKIDGTNIRVIYRDGQVSFGGRTDNAQIPAKLINFLKDRFTVEMMASVFPDCAGTDVVLYGEGCGAGIQKGGGNYSPDQRFVLFDVKIGLWLERRNVRDIARKFSIPDAPSILFGTIQEAEDKVREGFLSRVAVSSTPGFKAEGLVGRPLEELSMRNGERVIVKMKTRDYQ